MSKQKVRNFKEKNLMDDKETENLMDDKETEKLLAEWDIVRCQYCGKKISLQNAKLVRNGKREYFVCKGCLG